MTDQRQNTAPPPQPAAPVWGGLYQAPDVPWEAARAPATLGEIWDASRTLQSADNSDAADRRLERAWAAPLDAINDVRRREGKRPLFNPVYGIRVLPTPDPGTTSVYGFAAQVKVGQAAAAADIAAEVARIKKQYPGALKDVPEDPADVLGLEIAREQQRRAQARDVMGRSEGFLAGATAFAGSASKSLEDPLVQVTIPFGAGGQTIAGIWAREFALNAILTAVAQPQVAQNRLQIGETLTFGEAAENTLIAGALGGTLSAAPRALAKAWGLLPESVRTRWGSPEHVPDSAIPDIAEAVLGRDNIDPQLRDALHVISREEDVRANNPLGAAGIDQHATRMRAATDAIEGGEPYRVPRETSVVPQGQFKAKLATGESGGNDLAANPNSSAMGRYQFIAPTWLRYYVQRFGRQGLSDQAILAKRADPALQEQLVDDLIADNTAALRRLGAPATDGNLYLMHFAGQGGAGKILRAAPDTPIEQLLSKAAIDANPFLRGKSAADVIEWADAKMQSSGSRSILDASEAADGMAEVQRSLDQANSEAAAAARAASEPEALGGDYAGRLATEDADVPVRGMDWDPADVPVRDRGVSLVEARRAMEAGQMQEAPGLLWHPETGDITVRWGTPGDPARGYKGGFGLSHILAKHPEMGDILDRLPELLQTMAVKQRRSERLVLESADHEASIALTWHGDDQKWLLTAYEKPRPDPNSERGSVGGAAVSPRAGAEPNVRAAPADDKMAALEQQWALEAGMGGAPQPVWAVRDLDSGALVGWARHRPEAEGMIVGRSGNFDLERLMPPERSAGVPIEVELASHGFDDPRGKEAEAQVQSIEHDLRLEAERAPDTKYFVDDSDQPKSLIDILDDLDADAAEIDAIRRCL